MLVCVLAGCVTTANYDQFYVHSAPKKFEPTENIIYIDGDPNAEKTYEALFSDFLVVGRMSFNDKWRGSAPYVEYGKKVGADIVIASSVFDRDVQIQDSISIPKTNTSYVSGFDTYGTFYSGTVTTQGTQVIPYSYNVKRYDHDVVFLKRVTPDVKAPWEYTQSDFADTGETSDFRGTWKSENYVLETVPTEKDIVAFVKSVGEEATDALAETNPTLKWTAGDIKFRFSKRTSLGYYLMAAKNPVPAKLSINKFGHLEISLGEKQTFSFERQTAPGS
jgi:hypothetical protein